VKKAQQSTAENPVIGDLLDPSTEQHDHVREDVQPESDEHEGQHHMPVSADVRPRQWIVDDHESQRAPQAGHHHKK
jgi:hypothetical protein